MAAATFAAFYNDPRHWDTFDFDYPALLTEVGGTAAGNRAAVRGALLSAAVRSPVTVCFVIEGDEDCIHVGHSLSVYPREIGTTTAFDNRVVTLIGNDIHTAEDYVLPDEAFATIPNIRCLDIATISGAGGHGAAPPVFRSGPHNAGVANTTEITVRSVFTLPPNKAQLALTTQADGRYSLLGFYNTFLRDDLASADNAVVTAAEPLRDWYRAACTNDNNGVSRVSTVAAALQPNTPNLRSRLRKMTQRIREHALTKLGLGGPGLTSAMFQAGIATLQNTLTQNTTDVLDFERTRHKKTFTDKHGTALAGRMHRLCNVADDAHLPEIHQLLAEAPKGRESAILTATIETRVAAANLPISPFSSPLASTGLLNDVFRNLNVTGFPSKFASGLSPYAIVCNNHDQAELTRKAMAKAQLAEQGTSTSLADAESIIATDARFPTLANQAAEKLYGWSILIDIFFGVNHPFSNRVRAMVRTIGPMLYQVATVTTFTEEAGMDAVCRVLYKAQVDAFLWMGKAAQGLRTANDAPDFEDLITIVQQGCSDVLCPLPATWATIASYPGRRHFKEPPPAKGSVENHKRQAGMAPTFNSNADVSLMRRFKDHGVTTISTLMEGKDAKIPKHNNKDICLSWALKGACNATCRRQDQHCKYGAKTIKGLHDFLTACGVPAGQE